MPEGDAKGVVESECPVPGAQGEEDHGAGGHCFNSLTMLIVLGG